MAKGWIKTRFKSKKKREEIGFLCESVSSWMRIVERVEKERCGDGKEHSLTNKLSLRSDLSSKATQATFASHVMKSRCLTLVIRSWQFYCIILV